MNFYTSDHHFGHKAIIQLCKRPFTDIDEMNKILIENWNSKVTDNDTVYHLGDMFYKCSSGKRRTILESLKGKIVFIKGNHDYKEINTTKWRFVDVRDLFMIKDEFINRKIFMCHYPMENWYGRRRGTYLLHGDSHGNSLLTNTTEQLRIDVGVDCHNYQLLSSYDIENLMAKKLDYINHY